MQFDQLKRRDFITLLGSAAAWPLVARAQQRQRRTRFTCLNNCDIAGNSVSKFLPELRERGGPCFIPSYSRGKVQKFKLRDFAKSFEA